MRQTSMHARIPHGCHSALVEISARPAPRLSIVGLSEVATRETRVRVEMACSALGLRPAAAVHLSSNVPLGGALDLAIACAALDAAGELGAREPLPLFGEMSLAGELRAVRGLFTALEGETRAIVPSAQSGEAALRASCDCLEAKTLADVVRWFQGADLPLVAPRAVTVRGIEPLSRPVPELPWHDKGSAVLLIGEAGAGMFMHARARAATLGAPLPIWELLATWSTAGLLVGRDDFAVPFRAPHHTVSDAGLVGSRGRPGEVSLAHGGCLLLDDAADFRRTAMEALAHAVRAGRVLTPDGRVTPPWFPSKPQIIIGTCRPADAARARKLYPWTGEIEVPRLSVADLVASGAASRP
jgi:magnesium chelatase family protein